MAEATTSSDPLGRVSQAIRSFVESPVTNLVKGMALLFIGMSEVSHTLKEDIASGHVRVGHGLVLIGLFSVLDTLPHFLDGLEASERYLEYRRSRRTGPKTRDAGPADPKAEGNPHDPQRPG